MKPRWGDDDNNYQVDVSFQIEKGRKKKNQPDHRKAADKECLDVLTSDLEFLMKRVFNEWKANTEKNFKVVVKDITWHDDP